MESKQNAEPTDERSNGSAHETSPQAFGPDQELVYRLKSAIDQRGRYSFRLNDMAAGFAAGKQTSNAEARRSIEDKFTEHTGQSPQEYLDHHYAQRQQGRGPESDNGMDRGR
jgi:hypothetical protein